MGSPLAWRVVHTLLGLWVGMMIAQAFVTAPLVFGAVPEHIATKAAAGRITGRGFLIIDIVGIVTLSAVLIVYLARGLRRSWRAWLAAPLLLAALVEGLVIAPAIMARTEPLATYHRIATVLWAVAMLGGLLLLLAPAPSDPD